MKKINKIELELINGGALKCGWVGVLAVLNIGSPLLFAGDVIRCWNS